MHRVRVTTDFYFVPTRLLWPNWEAWIAGDSDVQAPYVVFEDDPPIGSIADYLGMPVTGLVDSGVRVSPLPFAAYCKIWNEYYRDQNLQGPIADQVSNGNNLTVWGTFGGTSPLRRAWQHDYFTAALPFAQKGDAVQVPLVQQDDIPVEFVTKPGGETYIRQPNSGALMEGGGFDSDPDGVFTVDAPGTTNAAYDPNGTLVVDVQAGATDINTLRRAFRLQEWLERNARGGTRYVENILSHFGVRSKDSRLQRPEFIQRIRQNMVISEVLSTAQTDADSVITPVGQLAGHGISVGGSGNIRYRATEHGYIFGIINVQPDTAYMQGLHRQFTRFDRLDYAWPTFANLGEQEILGKELYLGGSAEAEEVFGYIPRYSEYKYLASRVSGDMRGNLSFWHLARIFESQPALNEQFIKCDPGKRIFAVQGEDDSIYAHIFLGIDAVRKLPRFGVPTI